MFRSSSVYLWWSLSNEEEMAHKPPLLVPAYASR
jgi:hypothetical protein